MLDSPPMRDDVPHEDEPRWPNVGAADAAIRALLAPLVPVLAGFALSRWAPDWIPTLVIHGLVLTAYLALSAAARIDPLYEMFGWSTLGGAPRRRPRGSGRAPAEGSE